MKTLGIFIDESGDFDLSSKHSPYYIYTLLFHEQNYNLDQYFFNSYAFLKANKTRALEIHTSQILRKEGIYFHESVETRRALFNHLFYFARKLPITYKCFVYEKVRFNDKLAFMRQMLRDATLFLREHFDYFQGFDAITVYYDYGQPELTKIVNSFVAIELPNAYMRKIIPQKYKLSQVADLICTLELLSKKMSNNQLPHFMEHFFNGKRNLNDTYVKGIRKKQFNKVDSKKYGV